MCADKHTRNAHPDYGEQFVELFGLILNLVGPSFTTLLAVLFQPAALLYSRQIKNIPSNRIFSAMTLLAFASRRARPYGD